MAQYHWIVTCSAGLVLACGSAFETGESGSPGGSGTSCADACAGAAGSVASGGSGAGQAGSGQAGWGVGGFSAYGGTAGSGATGGTEAGTDAAHEDGAGGGGGAADAGTDAADEPAVQCGSESCSGAEFCCMAPDWTDATFCTSDTILCQVDMIYAPGAIVTCDEPSDCTGPNESCCGRQVPKGNGEWKYAEISCQAYCTPHQTGSTAWQVICDPAAADPCPAGRYCRDSTTQPGLELPPGYFVCSASSL